MDFEAQRAEVFADLFGGLGRRWLRIFQCVFESQALPFVGTELVERKHLNAVDNVRPALNDLSDLVDVLGVVCQAGNQNESDPHARWSTALGNSVAEVDSWLQVSSCDLLVGLREAGLDVE